MNKSNKYISDDTLDFLRPIQLRTKVTFHHILVHFGTSNESLRKAVPTSVFS